MPTELEQVFLATPVVTGKQQIISSPFQFYCDGTENLVLRVANSLPGQVVRVVWRWMQPDGTIQVVQQDQPVGATRAPETFTYKLDKGFLLNLMVRGSVVNGQTGQTYCIVYLRRGNPGAGPLMGTLLAGYITIFQTLGWPGSPIIGSTEGAGAVVTLPLGAIAANVTPSFGVPVNTRWAPLSFYGALQDTSGLGQFVHTVIVSASEIVARIPTVAALGAGLTAEVTFARGLGYVGAFAAGGTNWINAPLPIELLIPALGAVQIIVNNFGFQWIAPTLVVEEWLVV